MKNSIIYRTFWYEEIRCKVTLHRWIQFDKVTKEVVYENGAFARLPILIATFPVLLFCGLNQYYLYTKTSLDTFELLSILMIWAMMLIVPFVILREPDIRKALHDLIYSLELVDHLLSKMFDYSKRNRLVNYVNSLLSISLLVYNALALPAVFFFFVYPSTKVVDIIHLVSVYYWPAVVYSVLARRLMSDRLSIFCDVVHGLSKQKLYKRRFR